jgi:formylglycine-generating enzyme required for sulfatase activity
LGSPLIEKRLSSAPVITVPATTTITLTSQPIVPSKTIEPSQTPTEIYTLTVTPLPTEITDAKGVSMVLVPAGEFTMGFPPKKIDDYCKKAIYNKSLCIGYMETLYAHQVYLDAYYIDKYETTNAFYKTCVDAGVCDLPRSTGRYDLPGSANHPVIYVNWYQAQTYCEWRGAGLPTEAQWEKAARGIDGRTYPWGEEISCERANSISNFSLCAGNTTEVGSYESGVSPYGVYDMIGNVEEWVSDWYSGNYYQNSPSSNPVGPQSGQDRVIRSGASGESTTVFTRLYGNPSDDQGFLGFRCSRSP